MPFGRDFLAIPPVVEINTTSPRTVELLGKAFDAGETVPRRVELVRDLGATRLPLAVPYLLKAIVEPDALVRSEGARSLGIIGDASALPGLRALLPDPEESVRREAIVAGAILKDEAIVSEGLRATDPITLTAAISRSFSPAHVDAIVALLPTLDGAHQAQAISTLGRLGDARHGETVAGYLDRPIPVQVASLQALGLMKAVAQRDAVIAHLRDAHPTVRRAALQALSGVADVTIRQARALDALADPDLPIRTVAAHLLATDPTPSAIAPLVAQLSMDDKPLHDAALAALVAIKSDVLPAMVTLLDDPNNRRRLDALHVLWKLKSDAGLDKQIALANSQDWPVVAAAARSLGTTGRAEAVPALAKLALSFDQTIKLDDPEQATGRQEAVQWGIVGCGALNHPDILPPLMVLIPDWEKKSPYWRAAICWTIGATNSTQHVGAILGILGNDKDAEMVKLEVLKAVGNLRYQNASGLTSGWSTAVPMSSSPPLRYIAWWAHQRIERKSIPWEPIGANWSAEVSIRDMPEVK